MEVLSQSPASEEAARAEQDAFKLKMHQRLRALDPFLHTNAFN